MTPHDKINAIVEVLGISTDIQAKAMGIKPKTVRNKRLLSKDCFNEKNFTDLKSYVINKIHCLELI